MSYHWIESKSLNHIYIHQRLSTIKCLRLMHLWNDCNFLTIISISFHRFVFVFFFTGESMNVPEIYGLRNSLSESSSSLSNSSMNGSCVGTFAVTPTSSPDDSPLQLNAIPFSQISTMSSLNNSLGTPVKGFNSLQVSFCSTFAYRMIRKAARSKHISPHCSFVLQVMPIVTSSTFTNFEKSVWHILSLYWGFISILT